MSDLPKHVAIIMDGNGRWAQQRHLPRIAGHQAGAKAVKEIVRTCGEKGIAALTLFAFSSENWGRPTDEVSFLMELFLKTLHLETKNLHKNNVQLRIIGDQSRFHKKLQQRIHYAQQLTANNTGLKLIIAANYSGRWDIAEATRQLGQAIAEGKLQPEQITIDLLQTKLALADLPEPDLFIRTSGEVRISNFLLWQLAYTELYFTETLWPDFTTACLEQALQEYSKRQRRFGLTNEQNELVKLPRVVTLRA
ncbi:MAG: isoprenyl transferase [Gammaproteobacteria bacterium]